MGRKLLEGIDRQAQTAVVRLFILAGIGSIDVDSGGEKKGKKLDADALHGLQGEPRRPTGPGHERMDQRGGPMKRGSSRGDLENSCCNYRARESLKLQLRLWESIPRDLSPLLSISSFARCGMFPSLPAEMTKTDPLKNQVAIKEDNVRGK